MRSPPPEPGPAAPDEHPVLFRLRPPRPVSFVEVAGEMVHWYHFTPLLPGPDGVPEARFWLPPGCYAYKFRLGDGSWLLDPANPRTRACGGVQNSLLVVGGTPEPVLHAPAPPFVFLRDDGRVALRAGLRRGQGDALLLRWNEGHGERRTLLAPVAEEDEHLLLEAALPVSATGLDYEFLLADGRCIGASGGGGGGDGDGGGGGPACSLHLELAALQRRTPAWWRDGVLYTVFVDRFRRGGCGGRWSPAALGLRGRTAAGGDLGGLREALPWLAELGVTMLHLTPLSLGRSAHRYDTVELRRVDPALGGEEALAALLAEARRLGLRILIDLSVTHVHRDFFAFAEVRRLGPRSPYWDWFTIYGYPFGEGPHPGYAHYRQENWDEPMLRLEHPEVADYVVDSFVHWARLGVDGFRIDAAAEVPPALCRRIGEAVRQERPDAVLFAEVIPDNPQRWTAAGVDAATDFVEQQALYDWLWRRRSGARATAAVLARRRFWRGGPSWSGIAFTGTHDQPRLLTLTSDPAVARCGLLLTLLRAPVPALCYGEEVGLTGGEAAQRFEDVWPDRRPMPWDPASWDGETLELVRAALRLRRAVGALRRGDEEWPPVPLPSGEPPHDAVLAVRRRLGDEVVDVLVHGGPGERRVLLPAGAPSSARVLLRLGDAALELPGGDGAGPGAERCPAAAPDRLQDSAAPVARLGAWSALVLARELPAPLARTWTVLRSKSRELAVQAFRAGELQTPALPAHLYLTVTERCNLRCRHCINGSPERTRRGTARTVRPWLLATLGEPFAAADYVAFTHGGESLVAPVLWDVLAALRRAHQGRPGPAPDVHLLTNGMLLDEDTCLRLLDAGVNSLGVSLDGVSAATNEAIRVGAEHAHILANVQRAVRLRTELAADLRIGISFTVLAANLAELAEMGRLARELGVDWLKIEELFPANAFARRQLVDLASPALQDALAALRAMLDGSPVRLVEHLEPRAGCRCLAAGDPALLAFRDADDHANRARFSPCRMAWEQACIDPDGTLHPVDYHHPAAGSLSDAPLPVLWNGPVLCRVRQEALARLPADLRRRCPG